MQSVYSLVLENVFVAVISATKQNDFSVNGLYIIYLVYFSYFKLKCLFLVRCAINATPQKMSDTAAQLESFMKQITGNRKERKPVRVNIVEVRY